MIQLIILTNLKQWKLYMSNTDMFSSFKHLAHILLKKNRFQTKQNKALHNRTAPEIHASVLHLPGMHGLLAGDVHDWINCV